VMVKGSISRFLTDLHAFSTPEYEKVVLGMPSVCMYVCMCLSLAPERQDDFIYTRY
jgi:hypothetical protein